MKRKVWQKLTSFSLGAIMTLGFLASCAPDEGGGAEVDATVWTATSAVKVKKEDDYSSMYGNKTLSYTVFKNENESAQIFFNPTSEVQSFNLDVKDLKSASGDTLSKDSFSVYGQKYVEVKSITDQLTQTGAGWYPDAIVPLKNLADSKENTCEAGNNQGIWIKIKPSKEQAAGVYTGNFTLQLDGSRYDVPVSVEVLDYTLSDEKHSKQAFGIGYAEIEGAELDSSLEMQEAYYEFLQQYRIDANNLPGMESNYNPSSEGIEERLDAWVERLAQATNDERVGTTAIPYVNSSAVDENGNTVKCINIEEFRRVLTKMMDYTVEHNVNLFSKVHTYFAFLDERTLVGDVGGSNYTFNSTRTLYNEMVEEYRTAWQAEGELSEFQEDVLLSLKNIPDFCVGVKVEEMTSPATYVPVISYLSSADARQSYKDWLAKHYDEGYRQLWAYTCMQPKIPYPTYHTEDCLLSARMYSWMMYEYDIVGNLYWATSLFGYWGGKYGSMQYGYLQNQYNTANKYLNVNGDGYLIYPGREYGVYGPVSSVRLEAILDGNEDYDLLYALEQSYIARAAAKNTPYSDEAFNRVLTQLTKQLYTGVIYNYTEDYMDIFQQSRKTLNDLLLMSEKCGAIIENIETEKNVVKATISAPEGTEIVLEGATATKETANGITTYQAQFALVNDSNTLKVTAKKETVSYSATLDFGGKLQVESLPDAFEAGRISVQIDSGTATTVTEGDGKALQLTYNVVGGEEISGNTAIFNVSALHIDAEQKYITLQIKTDKEMKLAVAGKGSSKSAVYITAKTYELKAGVNDIRIELSKFNLKKNGELQLLRFNLADDTATGTYTVTLYDMFIGG